MGAVSGGQKQRAGRVWVLTSLKITSLARVKNTSQTAATSLKGVSALCPGGLGQTKG